MDTPQDFEIVENRGLFRPAAAVASFREVETLVNRAIEYAHHQRIPELLVNLQDLIGLPHPTFMDRFSFAQGCAGTANGRVRLAVVAPAEMIDVDKIGVTFAFNRGLDCNIFESELEAVAWLDRHPSR